jgi:hypothetical protein
VAIALNTPDALVLISEIRSTPAADAGAAALTPTARPQ